MNKLKMMKSAIIPVTILFSQQAWSQEGPGTVNEWTVGEIIADGLSAESLKIELNTPTTPAAAILGDDSISLSTLRSSSDFFTQFLSGVGTNGTIQPGIAIGGNPYWWLANDETLKEYRKKGRAFSRILKRTQFGLATKSKSDNGQSNSEIGVSLGWQLLDSQDPRMNKLGGRCLSKNLSGYLENSANYALRATSLADAEFAKMKNIVPKMGEELGGAVGNYLFKFADDQSIHDALIKKYVIKLAVEKEKSSKKYEKQYLKVRGECRDEYASGFKKGNSLTFTIASKFVSDSGTYGDLKEDKTALWLVFRSRELELINSMKTPIQAFASYSFDEEIDIDEIVKERGNRWTLGLGSSFENEGESLDFQASYITTDFATMRASTNSWRLTAAYSRRLRKGIWLEFKAGKTNSADLKNVSFAGINLKVDSAILLGK